MNNKTLAQVLNEPLSEFYRYRPAGNQWDKIPLKVFMMVKHQRSTISNGDEKEESVDIGQASFCKAIV